MQCSRKLPHLASLQGLGLERVAAVRAGIAHARFFSLNGHKERTRAIGRRRSVLGWSVAGIAGTAFVMSISSSATRHMSEAHHNESNGVKSQAAEGEAMFPQNIIKLVTGEGEKKDSMVSDMAQSKVAKLSWNGLSLLRSSITDSEIASTLSSWTWPASFTAIQTKFSVLLLELGRGPNSLFSQVVNDPPDPAVHAECQWDAEVRLGDGLCISERAFLNERRRKMKSAFARLFDVSEEDIDERDLPIVALAGSGGGYRAMVNTIGSMVGAQESGLLDCVTYTAGISGSCWALGVLYSGVAGLPTPAAAAEHLKQRIEMSYLDMNTLDMLITAPTNKYLLSGLLRKANSPMGTVSLTDLYGTLVSARLFVPSDLANLDPRHLSLHNFRRYVDSGLLPMPIFTAILHDIPLEIEKPLADVKEKKSLIVDSDRKEVVKKEEKIMEDQSRWLWFEFTPFEVGCDELGAWMPSWALGRRFENGKSLDRSPELSFTILSGIYASAFCASLQDYFKEVQPVLRQLPSQLYEWLAEIISDNDKEFGVIHPVVPNELPNYVKGMSGQLRNSSPPDITERETLGFMDAGAELNIPYYPLLRRDVDCIIALDASADYQDLWFTRAEEYAAKRGLSKWPQGARWPAYMESAASKETIELDTSLSETSGDPPADAANRELAEAQESEVAGQATKQTASEERGMPGEKPRSSSTNDAKLVDHKSTEDISLASGSKSRPISSCTIWMGSSSGSQESSKMDELEETDLLKRDGIAIVYNPLIPNDVVPDFDPFGISTWRLQMDRDETEKLLTVAEANFIEGQEKIGRLLKAIWRRKKAERESRREQ